MEYRLSKFYRSVFLILKPISYFFAALLYGLVFYLETIESSLDHNLLATIWEKAILILVGNLNSGHSYLITAVLTLFFRLWLWGHSPRPELNEASWIAEEQARMLWKPTLTNVHTQKWLWTWEIQKNMWSYWDFAKFSYTSFVLLEAAALCTKFLLSRYRI